MKKTRSITLSLALLSGCVASKDKTIQEPVPVYGPFREGIDGILDMLGDSVINREVSKEELDNCRAPMLPPEGYQDPQLRMMYRAALRSISPISRVRSNYRR